MTSVALPPAQASPAVTKDAFLGDRLWILQPATGYRAGIDAVLLAASVSVPQEDAITEVLDCGAGVGTVGLCVAARCPGARVTLVEREPVLLGLASRNIALNAYESRVTALSGDIIAPASDITAPRLDAERFDHVLANPPFHDDTGGTHARDPLKRVSHAMHPGALDDWVRFAARMAKPGGRVHIIHKAEALPALIDALKQRFGALSITPIHSYATTPAIRVMIAGIKGSRAPLALHPPIILHDSSGAFTPHVGQILRHGAPLPPQPKD